MVADLQPLVEDWRVGRKKRIVVANLQPPAGGLEGGEEGNERGC